MVCAIQIADGNFVFVDGDAANGTVTKQEPGVKSVGGLTPGQVEDSTHQVDEESTVADQGDTLFRLTVLIPMPCEKLCPYTLRAQLTFSLCLLRMRLPPARIIQVDGEYKFRIMFFKK